MCPCNSDPDKENIIKDFATAKTRTVSSPTNRGKHGMDDDAQFNNQIFDNKLEDKLRIMLGASQLLMLFLFSHPGQYHYHQSKKSQTRYCTKYLCSAFQSTTC